MNKDNSNSNSNYALSRLLCAKAASALRGLTQLGISADPRLMAVIDAKLSYLEGRMTADQLKGFWQDAEEARIEALQALVEKPDRLREATFTAAEAATCAASIEQGPDVEDPILEAMLMQYLLSGKCFTDFTTLCQFLEIGNANEKIEGSERA